MTVANLQVILEASDTDLNAKLDKAENRLSNFGKDAKAPKIDLDIGGALQKLDQLAARINALRSAPLSFSANAGGAQQAPTVRGVSREEFQVQKDWNSALAETERRARAAARAIDGIGSSAKSNESFVGRFSERVASLATSLVIYRGLQMAWQGLTGTFKEAFSYESQLQNNLIGTTNILHGNAAAAKSLQAQLQQFAITTPTRFKDLLPDEQQLLAAKTAVKDIIPELRAMGDAAFGLNRGQEGVNRLTLAFAQASATGRITGETLREMRHVGVPAIQYLAQAWHVSTTEMQDMISKKMIGAKEGLAAITAGMEIQFHGQMDKMSHTAEGAFSNIKDAADKILGSAFESTFGKISELANKAATISSNKDFQAWCADVAKWFQGGFGVAVESVEWLGTTTVKVAPLILGALTAIGVRALFVGATQVPGASIAGIRALSALATQFMATGAASTLMTGIIGVALAALVTDFGGVRSKLIDGWKSLTTWIARQYDGLMKFLHVDTGGVSFEASVKATMPDLDKTVGGWKSSLAGKMKGLNLGNPFGNLLPPAPDWDKWSKSIASGAGKIPAMPDLTGHFLDDASAKKKAALKLEKDQLADAAKEYDAMAKAAEDSAKRQIAALTSVRDTLRGLFGSMQDALLKEGVTSNPLASVIARFESKLGIESKMRAIAQSTAQTSEYYNGKAQDARGRLDKLGGGDGYDPPRHGFNGYAFTGRGGTDNSSFDASVTQAIIAGIHTPMGAMACARFVSKAFDMLHIGVTHSESAAQLEKNARRAGARRIPLSEASEGDLLVGPGGGPSGRHVGIAMGHGMFAAKNRDRYSRIAGYGFDSAYDTSALASGHALRGLPSFPNPSYIPKNNAATIKQMYSGEAGSIADQIDGTLSKIAAVPKAWGAAVRDTETSTNRFQTQTALANKEFQTYWRAIEGANFDNFVKQLRVAANQADILLNRVRSLHQSYKNIKELDKADALRGHENDPIAALRYDFAHDRKTTPANQQQWEILKKRADVIGGMAQSTQEFIEAQQRQAQALAAGDKYLRADTLSLSEYSRAVDLANIKLQLQNGLIQSGKLNSIDPHVRADAQKELETQYRAQVQTYDAGKRRGAVTEVLGSIAAMKQRAAMLVMERGLIQQGTKSEQQIADAIEAESVRRETLNKLVAAGVPLMVALALANAQAAGSLGLKQYDEASAKLKEYSDLVKATARSVALSNTESAIYGSTPSYSPQLEKRLAMAREEARLRADDKSNYSDSEIADRLGQFGKSFDANARTGAVSEYSKLLGDAAERVATLGDETGMAALKFRLFQGDLSANLTPMEKIVALFSQTIARAKGLREEATKAARNQLASAQQNLDARRLESAGQLSDLAKQELAWKYEDLQRAKENNAASAEELAIRQKIRDVLQQTAQIHFEDMIKGLQDQARVLTAPPGTARDALQRRIELEKDPNLSPDQRETILAQQNQLAQVQKSEQVWQDSAQKMQEMFRSSIDSGITTGLHDGFGKGVKDTIGSFAKQFEDMMLSRGKDIIAAKLTNHLFGAGVAQMPDAFRIGARGGLGFNPAASLPLLASIKLPDSVTGPPNLAGTSSGIAGAVASALGINTTSGAATDQTMSAQNVTINSRTATINAPLASGGMNSGMGAPTASQGTFSLLNAGLSILNRSGAMG